MTPRASFLPKNLNRENRQNVQIKVRPDRMSSGDFSPFKSRADVAPGKMYKCLRPGKIFTFELPVVLYTSIFSHCQNVTPIAKIFPVQSRLYFD